MHCSDKEGRAWSGVSQRCGDCMQQNCRACKFPSSGSCVIKVSCRFWKPYHRGQSKDNPWWTTSLCAFSFELLLNFSPHSSQSYEKPSWMWSLCLIKDALLLYSLSHSSHLYFKFSFCSTLYSVLEILFWISDCETPSVCDTDTAKELGASSSFWFSGSLKFTSEIKKTTLVAQSSNPKQEE